MWSSLLLGQAGPRLRFGSDVSKGQVGQIHPITTPEGDTPIPKQPFTKENPQETQINIRRSAGVSELVMRK